MYVILTRLKLKRGEGKLAVTMPQVRSRTRRESFPQSPPQVVLGASESMSHEGYPENMSGMKILSKKHSLI